jgi:hypothetical protein
MVLIVAGTLIGAMVVEIPLPFHMRIMGQNIYIDSTIVLTNPFAKTMRSFFSMDFRQQFSEQ